MSIFEPSTPVEITPDEDTVVETAEEEITEEEVTEEYEQEEEKPEEEADSETEHSNELYAGKYKTLGDFEKAYKSLERSFHESRQQPQQPQQQYQDDYQESPNDIILRALQEDPAGTLNYFVQQSRAEERKIEQYDNTLKEIATNYKSNIKSEAELQTLTEKYWEIAAEVGTKDGKNARIMKLAAEELWGKQSIAQVYRQAEQAGAQKAEMARKAKVGLNAPGNSKIKDTPKTQEELIADSIVSAGSRKGMFG